MKICGSRFSARTRSIWWIRLASCIRQGFSSAWSQPFRAAASACPEKWSAPGCGGVPSGGWQVGQCRGPTRYSAGR